MEIRVSTLEKNEVALNEGDTVTLVYESKFHNSKKKSIGRIIGSIKLVNRNGVLCALGPMELKFSK